MQSLAMLDKTSFVPERLKPAPSNLHKINNETWIVSVMLAVMPGINATAVYREGAYLVESPSISMTKLTTTMVAPPPSSSSSSGMYS